MGLGLSFEGGSEREPTWEKFNPGFLRWLLVESARSDGPSPDGRGRFGVGFKAPVADHTLLAQTLARN